MNLNNLPESEFPDNNVLVDFSGQMGKRFTISWQELLEGNYKHNANINCISLVYPIMFDNSNDSYYSKLTSLLYELSHFDYKGWIYVFDSICDTTRDWIRNMPTIINVLVHSISIYDDNMFKLIFSKTTATDKIMSTIFSDRS